MYQKSHNIIEESRGASPVDEDADIRIRVYYNSTK